MSCIEHNQKGNKSGYGNGHWEGRQVMLHRLAYCFNRKLPIAAIDGLVVMHTCDNPRCVNPEHLKLGSQGDNMQDMQDKGRMSTGSAHYISKLSEEDVLWARSVYTPRHKEFSCHALARRFGVNPTTMHNAISGKRWAHVNS